MTDEQRRRDELFESRFRKITIAHQIDKTTTVQAEVLIDEMEDAGGIFRALQPIDDAFARMEAKAELNRLLNAMLNKCGEIEMSVRKHAAERYSYEVKNRAHNANKRIEIGLNAAQQQNLKQNRDAIRDGFERIDEMQKAVEENRRVLDGGDPFEVLVKKIDERLHALRGERQDAA